jgi:hypothetical protein
VLHYEYLEWPDYYVPLSTRSVRELIRALFNIPPQAGPFVVHCRCTLFISCIRSTIYLPANCETPTSFNIMQCTLSFIYWAPFPCLQCWHRKDRNLLYNWSHPPPDSLWWLDCSRYWKHGAPVQIAAWWNGANEGKILGYVNLYIWCFPNVHEPYCAICWPNRNNTGSSTRLWFKSLRTTSAVGWDQRALCSPEEVVGSRHCSLNSNQGLFLFLLKVLSFILVGVRSSNVGEVVVMARMILLPYAAKVGVSNATFPLWTSYESWAV